MQVASCRPIRPIRPDCHVRVTEFPIIFIILRRFYVSTIYRWKITRLLQAAGLSGWM